MIWRLTILVLLSLSIPILGQNSIADQIPILSPEEFAASPGNRTEIMASHLQEHDGFRTVAYFVNWAIYARNHNPQDLPANKLTHILYAFANIRPETGEVYLTDSWSDIEKHYPTDSWNDPDGGNNMYGCLKQLHLLKRQNRNLKLLLSIGGWTYSKNFVQPASTEEGRRSFARSAVQLIKDYGFDGVDIDWEYPQTPQEAANYLSLLQTLRAEMDAYQRGAPSTHPHRPPHFLLTIAAPAGPQNYDKLPLKDMARCLDFINLMAYDYAGSWDATAGHQSNFYPDPRTPAATPFSTVRALEDYTARGVPASKLVLGMPLYGRSFLSCKGPGTPYSGSGEGSWERGVWDFKQLPREGAREYFDPKLGASWSLDERTGEMVSYDNAEAARMKVAEIRARGLGGAMWWESSADRAGDASLIAAVWNGLGGPQNGCEWRENEVEFPHSRFANLRLGFPGDR